jgi:hypothetical protein
MFGGDHFLIAHLENFSNFAELEFTSANFRLLPTKRFGVSQLKMARQLLREDGLISER